MKTPFTFCLAAVLLSAGLCDCTSESPEEMPQNTAPAPTLSGVITGDGSKTGIQGTDICWMPGDGISVFIGMDGSGSHANAMYSVSSIGDEGKSATFDFSPTGKITRVSASPDSYTALYPYLEDSSLDTDSGIVSLNLPASYNGCQGGVLPEGSLVMLAQGSGSEMYFRQTEGVLEIDLSDPDGAVIESVSVSAKGVSGAVTINSNASLPVLRTDEAASTVTYNYGSGCQLGREPVKLYIPMPEGEHSGLKLVFTDSSGGQMTRTAGSLHITRGVVTPAPMTYVGGTPAVTDLSPDGKWANCYNVCAAGDYCFDACDADGTPVSGTRATWAWATTGMWTSSREADAIDEFVRKIHLVDGKVRFSVPEGYTPGNVVLAVTDASGQINYSWHIWLTADAPRDMLCGTVKVLDRNLGASEQYKVELPEARRNSSRGLCYQWGRKDPVVGPYGTGAESSMFAQGGDNCSTYYIYNSSLVNAGSGWQRASAVCATTAAASAYPLTLLSAVGDLPHYNSSTGMEDVEGVAIWHHDANPCPYGYHVIKTEEIKYLLSEGVSANVSGDEAEIVLKGGAGFPRIGYRSNNGKIISPTTDVKHWTYEAVANSSGVFTTGRWYALKTDGYGTAGALKTHATAIRCVSDESSTVLPNISGSVRCAGTGLEGVWVSDGRQWARTGFGGTYSMRSDKSMGYVFVVLPSGYEAPSGSGCPEFWQALSSTDVEVAETHDFTLTKRDQSVHRAVMSADWHLTAGRYNDVSDWKSTYKAEMESLAAKASVPVYGFALGDLSWDSFWYNAGCLKPAGVKALISGSGVPTFALCGNHDYDWKCTSDLSAAATWVSAFGPRTYAVNIGNVHYIVLDNIKSLADGSTTGGPCTETVKDYDLQWLKEDLSHVEKSTPVVLCSHSPYYGPVRSGGSWTVKTYTDNAPEVMSLLSEFDKVMIFAGHRHICSVMDLKARGKASGNIVEHCVPAAGGHLWITEYYNPGVYVTVDGNPAGVKILDADGSSLSTSYKGFGKSASLRARAYDLNKLRDYWESNAKTVALAAWNNSYSFDKLYPFGEDNGVLVNIFEADPFSDFYSGIEMLEDGSPLSVSNVACQDPLAVAAYEAEAVSGAIGYQSSFKSVTSTHMYYATARSATSTITLKLTDRYGNTYTCEITRPKAFVLTED